MKYCYILCIATISAINILFSVTAINGSHRRTQENNPERLKTSSKATHTTQGGTLGVFVPQRKEEKIEEKEEEQEVKKEEKKSKKKKEKKSEKK